MKHNNSFTIVVLFAVVSLLLSSCSGVRYAYFNKQKVPYKAEETKLAKAIPAKPFLTQSENELKEKAFAIRDKKEKQKSAGENPDRKEGASPVTPAKILKELDFAKYIPKVKQSSQSEDSTQETDRTLMIVLLVVLIIIVIALLGDELIWLLFVALLILLIYFLVKYLGIFN